MKLPISSMLCCARSDTRYLPTLCIQSKDVLPFPFIDHTVCIYYIWQAFLKFSVIFFRPFVPVKSSLTKSFLVLDFVSTINYSFHPVFEISRFVFVSPGIPLSVSPQRLSLTFLVTVSNFFSILSPFSKMPSSSKSITVPSACIDVIASSLIQLVSFSNSLFHAVLTIYYLNMPYSMLHVILFQRRHLAVISNLVHPHPFLDKIFRHLIVFSAYCITLILLFTSSLTLL